MTSDQYTELVAFLARKFEDADRKTEAARRHATVLFEQAAVDRRTMAEGLGARIDTLTARVESVEDTLGARIGLLERTTASLDASVRVVLADHESRLQALE